MSDDYGPTHIVDIAGAKVTRCGRMGKERFPLVLAEYVQAHIDGRGMTVCPGCFGIPNLDLDPDTIPPAEDRLL